MALPIEVVNLEEIKDRSVCGGCYLRTAYKDGHPRPTSLNVSRALHMGLKMVTYLQNCHHYSYYDVYGGNDVERAS